MKKVVNSAPAGGNQDFINALVQDLEPVKPVTNVGLRASAWVLGSIIYIVALMHYTGPIRDNAFQQLLSSPRFLLEMVGGLALIIVAGWIAFRSAVPGRSVRKEGWLFLALFGLFIANFLVGLAVPTFEPSMHGKRAHCVVEIFLYAVVPIVLAWRILGSLYPLQPTKTALFVGISAGLVPGVYMQIACMYSAEHALVFHFLPALATGVLAGAGVLGYYKIKDKMLLKK